MRSSASEPGVAGARLAFLALALSLVACSPLAPSGGRRGEPLPSPTVSPVPGPRPGGPAERPVPSPSDAALPTVLEVVVNVASADGPFAATVQPTLATNCATGGCHATPEVIDLRAYPFAAEGSYAMDDIRARHGDNPDPHVVQVELVKVLIDSMRSVYMPPAPAAPVGGAALAQFDAWLAGDLATAVTPFHGSVTITARDADGVAMCELTGAVDAGTYRGQLDRGSCAGATLAVYEIKTDDGGVVGRGELAGTDFFARSLWKVDLAL